MTLQAQAPVAAAVAAPARPLVLVVDDEATTRLLSRATLEQAGFAVVDAFDGPGALEAYERLHPDLVLLDVEMPVLDGPEMAYQMFIRDLGLESIPIVLLSGVVDLESVAAHVGTPYFLGKPYSLNAIFSLCERALAERTPPRPVASKSC